jgi:hypothetical protein
MAERLRRRVELADGRTTTVHVVQHRLSAVELRVQRLAPEVPFERWCEEHGVDEGVSGGFAVKPTFRPLGELRIGGQMRDHQPFRGSWSARRAAVAVIDGQVHIAQRHELPERPDGDLLQAGPLLVRDGRSAITGVEDPEGFSDTADEFDQDLTASREPRLALALGDETLLAVAADGRGPDDAGLTLWELADLLVELDARHAINLDGGSACVIVSGGERLNVPRDDDGEELEVSSPSVTGLVLRSG